MMNVMKCRTRMNRIMIPLALMLAFLPAGRAFAIAQGTLATFSDPSGGSVPLFNIDLTANQITGGWSDALTGLDLEIIWTGDTYEDAFFVLPQPIPYTGDITGGQTGLGAIEFYADGADPQSEEPLLKMVFQSAYLSSIYGIGATNLFQADNVEITGSVIKQPLSEEQFSFSFANARPLNGDWNNGFSATASLTSSAVPEPLSLSLLAAGSLLALRRKKTRQ